MILKGTSLKLVPFLLCILWALGLSGQDSPLELNDEFFSNFLKMETVRRDIYLETLLEKPVKGHGIIKSIDQYKRYDRDIRIIAADMREGIEIFYYIFTGNKRLRRRLRVGAPFDFEGHCMLFTPLTPDKSSYILDIRLTGD